MPASEQFCVAGESSESRAVEEVEPLRVGSGGVEGVLGPADSFLCGVRLTGTRMNLGCDAVQPGTQIWTTAISRVGMRHVEVPLGSHRITGEPRNEGVMRRDRGGERMVARLRHS